SATSDSTRDTADRSRSGSAQPSSTTSQIVEYQYVTDGLSKRPNYAVAPTGTRASASAALSRLSSPSISSLTFSPTSTPPLPSGTFQTRPQSLRLMLPVRVPPTL